MTRCQSCGSGNLGKFTGELAVHFPGVQNIDKPHVWLFPELVVCLDCGLAQFTVPQTELLHLNEGSADDSKSESETI